MGSREYMKSIRLKTEEEWLALLGSVAQEFERDGVVSASSLDLAVLILLEIYRKEVPDRSALDELEWLFSNSEGGPLWEAVCERFVETRDLVARFRDGSAEEKLMLRPAMLSRGLM